MDLLFKRYASPFLFIEGMLQTGRFSEFVSEFIHTINVENEDETSWEFFLHKVQEGSFASFKDELETNRLNQNISKTEIDNTVQHSIDILNNFNPERGDN